MIRKTMGLSTVLFPLGVLTSWLLGAWVLGVYGGPSPQEGLEVSASPVAGPDPGYRLLVSDPETCYREMWNGNFGWGPVTVWGADVPPVQQWLDVSWRQLHAYLWYYDWEADLYVYISADGGETWACLGACCASESLVGDEIGQKDCFWFWWEDRTQLCRCLLPEGYRGVPLRVEVDLLWEGWYRPGWQGSLASVALDEWMIVGR